MSAMFTGRLHYSFHTELQATFSDPMELEMLLIEHGYLRVFRIILCEGECMSCDGRVVKALDLKSNGVFPRRFESCSQR